PDLYRPAAGFFRHGDRVRAMARRVCLPDRSCGVVAQVAPRRTLAKRDVWRRLRTVSQRSCSADSVRAVDIWMKQYSRNGMAPQCEVHRLFFALWPDADMRARIA